ncbi:hypothetical protein [Azomonas macrocytogenes]|uniref:Uncharacterized protein n=1 Tax=Azomonas macrocytogenes TaxID=69962 RepID=A0A839SXZ8_AZOMA|nr:hypothetical protein [Azomonas macrocytogenes]MBB3101788.1 hypothetical protein [Azomonas macrocytogenes]
MNQTPPPEEPEAIDPWPDLAPEHFELLRLAPLPIERSTGQRPLHFARFGRAECNNVRQSLLHLDIRLPGQTAHGEMNRLDVQVDHQRKAIRFGKYPLVVEPQNRGLGRFLLAQGIAWAQRRWASYAVEGGELPPRDASTEESRQRRDHVLHSQGFQIDYEEGQENQVRYGATRVGALDANWNIGRVQIVDTLEAANLLEQAERSLNEQQASILRLEERLGLLRREDGALRFAIICLVVFVVFQAGLLIWIATR